MKKTANYQLNQWEAADPVRRTDFNADNAAIDAAIKAAEQNAVNALAAYQSTTDAKLTDLSTDRIYFGSYMGDGASERTIQLPFMPKIAIVFGHYYSTSAKMMLYLFTQDVGCEISQEGAYAPSTWYYLAGDCLKSNSPNWSNYSGITVHYILIK